MENEVDVDYSISVLKQVAEIRQVAYKDGYHKGMIDAYTQLLGDLNKRISEFTNE